MSLRRLHSYTKKQPARQFCWHLVTLIFIRQEKRACPPFYSFPASLKQADNAGPQNYSVGFSETENLRIWAAVTKLGFRVHPGEEA